jgi:hypothetical protein
MLTTVCRYASGTTKGLIEIVGARARLDDRASSTQQEAGDAMAASRQVTPAS